MVFLEWFSYPNLLLIRGIRWYGLKVGKIGEFLEIEVFDFLVASF